MNLWSVTALGIGAMVGAGIFAVLGQTALLAGKQTYVSFILGGLRCRAVRLFLREIGLPLPRRGWHIDLFR